MKRKFKVALALFLVLAFTAMALTGCGGKGDDKQQAGGGEKVTLRFSHWRGEDVDVFRGIIEKFEKENPNIKVEMSVNGSEAYIASIQAELQSSKGPDVFTVYPGSHFETIYRAGAFTDLSNQDFLNNYVPNLITAGQKDGKQWAVPYQLVYNIPVYNKAIFARYGIEPPKDWESFLKACETLKKNGVTPILFSGDISPGQFINPMLMNNQPDERIFDKVMAGEAKLTDDWFVKTLDQIKTLNDRGYFQEGALGTKKEGAAALFAQEKGAMLAHGSYMMATIKKQNPNIDMGLLAPITVPADKVVWEGIHTTTFMLAINSKSQHKEEAAKFIAFLSRPDIAAEYANATGQMLTLKDVKYDTPELQEQAKWLGKKTRFQPRYLITSEEVKKAVEVAIQDVMNGMFAKEAAAKAQAVVDRVRGKQ